MWSVLLISAYLLLMLIGSFRNKSRSNEAEDYLLAGRKITLLPFVATMVTTAYGWILGIGELYYDYGISAWLFLSLPYTLFAVLMAFFLSARIRKEQLRSIPELLARYYGPWYARIGSLAVLVLVSPAMYVLMSAQLLRGVYGWPILSCIALALVFSSVYLYRGGFASIASKDSVKFFFMFGGFLLVLAYLLTQYGTEPLTGLPPRATHFSFEGNVWEIVTWFLLASLVIADPGYHQRIYASANSHIPRTGLLISILCWTVFDFLAATVALYGLALVPGLTDSSQIYTQIGELLPDGLQALFILGLLATVMSTTDSFLFLSAQSLMIDLLGFRNHTQRNMNIGLVLVSLFCFALLLPYRNDSAVVFFFDFTPWAACTLVLPVFGALIPSLRLGPAQSLIQLIFSLTAGILWQSGFIHETGGISPVVPGMSVSLIMHIVFIGYRRLRGIR